MPRDKRGHDDQLKGTRVPACEPARSSARTPAANDVAVSCCDVADEGEVMPTRCDIRAITREAQRLPGGALILGGLLLLIDP